MKKLTPVFLIIATFSLIFLSIFAFPIQLDAKTHIDTAIELDKNFYSTTETVKIRVTLKAAEDEKIKRTRIRLRIFDRLEPGTSVTDYKTKGKRSIFRRTWYESIDDEEKKFDFEKDLSKYNIGEGVYPVELNVDLENGKEVSENTLLVIKNKPREQLSVYLVWNWHLPQKLGPSGILGPGYLKDKVGTIRDPGVLLKYTSLISRYREVKLNMAFSPALLSDIDSVSKGYKYGAKKIKSFDDDSPLSKASSKLISDLKIASKEEGRIDVLEVPFGYPSLPTLLSLGWKNDFDEQIKKGRSTLTKILERDDASTTLFFPGLAIDQISADRVKRAGIERAVISPEFFKSRPRNVLAGPYDISSHKDQELQSFSADTEFLEIINEKKRSEIKKYLHALIAMRLLSYDDEGAIVAVIDGGSDLLAARKVEEVLKFFNNNPWTKSEVLSDFTSPRTLKKRALVSDAADVLKIDDDYLIEIKRLKEETDNFYEAISKDNKVSLDIEESFFASESYDRISSEWFFDGAPRLALLDEIESVIEANYSNIIIESTQTITFSGRKGKIPIAILNKNNYPVYLTLKLDGGKDFSFSDDKNNKVKIMPKENLLVYKVDTNFKGLSTLKISLFSGSREIVSGRMNVSVSNVIKSILNVVSVASLLVIGGFIIKKRVTARGKDG